jgi:AraC family transcriptional activator FtrA
MEPSAVFQKLIALRRVIRIRESWVGQNTENIMWQECAGTCHPANGRMTPMSTKTDIPWRQDREHRVAVLLFDRPSMFETSVAIEVWGNDRTAQGVPYSDVRICSNDGPTLQVEVGFELVVKYDLSALEWADTIVVPNGYRTAPSLDYDPEAMAALCAAYERGARIISFCSGAFALAATGLLDGKEATTHWTYAKQFQARHPSIDLKPDVLYTGGDRLFTSAGTSAAIDLCLHLVREDWGAEVANTIARRMVVPPHRDGGQAQYVEQPMPVSSDVDGDLRAVLQWVEGNLDRQLTVDELARRAAMTPRTFARRFKAATGTTPLQWILHQRVVVAQRMLETSTVSVDEIAATIGFGSAAALRQHFTKVVGSTPSAYRATFRHAA